MVMINSKKGVKMKTHKYINKPIIATKFNSKMIIFIEVSFD